MSLEKIIRISSRAVVVPGDDIDTDRIIPARYLKSITFDGLGEFAFYDERKNADGTDRPHPLNDPVHAGAGVLVSGFNFGCGSSREHAPQSLRRAGFRVVVAGSFAEIFSGNATAIGLACVTPSRDDLAAITTWVQAHPGESVTVDIAAQTLAFADRLYAITLPAVTREALVNGRWDAIADLLEGADAAAATAARLPYIN
ncbi:MAG: 3-isopropylmalate dehydratase small subunit [Puniceicoccales bacterium]|jgi:3-isopropylmalate/(R)-2-methylmalate dehydratase small subunit|nr:3-isopropylmalate dehydratase small subunit [Puniceicoccales bacterium]